MRAQEYCGIGSRGRKFDSKKDQLRKFSIIKLSNYEFPTYKAPEIQNNQVKKVPTTVQRSQVTNLNGHRIPKGYVMTKLLNKIPEFQSFQLLNTCKHLYAILRL